VKEMVIQLCVSSPLSSARNESRRASHSSNALGGYARGTRNTISTVRARPCCGTYTRASENPCASTRLVATASASDFSSGGVTREISATDLRRVDNGTEMRTRATSASTLGST
jgi:hypothetical protein